MNQKIILKTIKAELLISKKIFSLPKNGNNKHPRQAYAALDKRFTKFDIKSIAHKQRSKKARSDTITVREGGNLSYHMEGKLIRLKKNRNPINNSILIRNNVDLTSFEISMPIFSPLTTKLSMAGKVTHKAYYLRNSAPHKSKLDFEYTRDYE